MTQVPAVGCGAFSLLVAIFKFDQTESRTFKSILSHDEGTWRRCLYIINGISLEHWRCVWSLNDLATNHLNHLNVLPQYLILWNLWRGPQYYLFDDISIRSTQHLLWFRRFIFERFGSSINFRSWCLHARMSLLEGRAKRMNWFLAYHNMRTQIWAMLYIIC